jgi:hypothetical protein
MLNRRLCAPHRVVTAISAGLFTSFVVAWSLAVWRTLSESEARFVDVQSYPFTHGCPEKPERSPMRVTVKILGVLLAGAILNTCTAWSLAL